jgi:hypothetical protein
VVDVNAMEERPEIFVATVSTSLGEQRQSRLG